jgi:hypothetical protein
MSENIGLKRLEKLEMEFKIMKKKAENAKGLVNTSKGIHEWVQRSIVNLLNNHLKILKQSIHKKIRHWSCGSNLLM